MTRDRLKISRAWLLFAGAAALLFLPGRSLPNSVAGTAILDDRNRTVLVSGNGTSFGATTSMLARNRSRAIGAPPGRSDAASGRLPDRPRREAAA